MERREPDRDDARSRSTSTSPSWPGCCRCSTRASFPNLAAYTKPRADLNAILLTGIPEGVVPGFQNYTGPVQADMLRLNVAVRPPRSRTRSAWWPATRPASPTAAGSTTTS